MRYVDAGYVIALCVLVAYAIGLVLRRRRLARAAHLEEPAQDLVRRGKSPEPSP